MSSKEKLEATKNRLKSGAQSAGKQARRAGKVAWKGLNSKPGRVAVYAGVAGAARSVQSVHPVVAVAALVVTAGAQAWANES